MKNRSTYIFLAFALATLLGLFYWRYLSGQQRFDWRDSWSRDAYSETSDQPYGTKIAHRLLENYFPAYSLQDIRKTVAETLPADSTGNSSYIFVGEAMYLDSLSTARLLAFVGAGNTALLSGKTIPFDLMFHLYYVECEEAEWNDYEMYEDSVVSVSLNEPEMRQEASLFYARQNKVQPYRWSYIESYFFCDSLPQAPLGYLDDSLINFAVFPYQKGRFLLHTTPIAFSNFHLLRPEGRRYAAGVLSHLPEGNIYWDACSRVPEAVGRQRNQSDRYSSGRFDAERPLSYILKQPALAWAWFLLVGLAVVYVIFRAKRRQRIIPVLAKNENSSYEFISTIANLHFREKNYQNLCIQSMRLFLAQLRERYGLVAQMNPDTLLPRTDAGFLERLAQVSEMPVLQIRDIFTQYAATIQFEPTEEMMVNLHVSMESFLKRAK